MDSPDSLLNALTIDVEDYFHVEAFSSSVSRETWDSYALRVEANTHRLLDVLDDHGVKGTFFVLGWVARKVPSLVGRIADRGHEIGCHSFWHRLVYSMDREVFRSDLRDATRAIEDAAGVRPRGYRAPSFSIVRRSLWALEVLAEEGYEYDSSIFPIRHDIYGFPGFPRFPVRVTGAAGGARGTEGAHGGGDAAVVGTGSPGGQGTAARVAGIVEFPASTVRILGRTLPGPGGGYLRILPLWYSLWALRRINVRDGRPATIYLHPWELDPGQPRLQGRPRSRFRHYTHLATTEARLRTLLSRFRFGPMSRVLEGRTLETAPLASFA